MTSAFAPALLRNREKLFVHDYNAIESFFPAPVGELEPIKLPGPMYIKPVLALLPAACIREHIRGLTTR